MGIQKGKVNMVLEILFYIVIYMGMLCHAFNFTTLDVPSIIYFVRLFAFEHSFSILESWTPCMYLAVHVEG